jgi:predicted house-cleaning noncanonical NTP pyrophosphatase (MazG superfamily)
MNKSLIRDNVIPENSEALSTSEFMSVALEQIASSALSVKDADEAEPVLDAMSDILELMCEYLKAKNIHPESLFEHAEEVRNIKGTFQKKVAVSKD